MSTLQRRHEKLVKWIIGTTTLLQAGVACVSVTWSDLPSTHDGAKATGEANSGGISRLNVVWTRHFWSVVLGIPLLTPLAAAAVSYFRKSGWQLLSPEFDFAGRWRFKDEWLIKRSGAIGIEEYETSGVMTVKQDVFGILISFDFGDAYNIRSTQRAAQVSDDGQSIYTLHQIKTGVIAKQFIDRDGLCAEAIQRVPYAGNVNENEDVLGRPYRMRGEFSDTGDFNRVQCVGCCIYERIDKTQRLPWVPAPLRLLLKMIGQLLDG